MAVRQYIGARYVTKFYQNSLDPLSTEWESGVFYEALTQVMYNYDTYISRMDVPDSVGDPASNPYYWAKTGDYNGQIATIQNELQLLEERAIVVPQYFGAVGDGVTDDSDAVIACIDFAKANNNIVMFTGTYLITKQIKLFDGCKLFGKDATVLVQYNNTDTPPDSYNWACIDCSNCKDIDISFITFTGTGAQSNTYTHCIFIGGAYASNVNIHHCNFNDVQGEGAIIFFESHYITAAYNNIKEYTYTGIAFWDYTDYSTASHNNIINGHLTSSGHIDRYAIGLCGMTYNLTDWSRPMPENLTAEYNYISDDMGEWEGIDAHGGTHIKVSHNTIRNCCIPIAVFTDTDRYFKVTYAEVDNNVCIMTEANLPSNKLWYSGAFSGEFYQVHDNIFDFVWSAWPSDPGNLSKFYGVTLGIKRGSFYNNRFNQVPVTAIALNAGHSLNIHDNEVINASAMPTLRFIWISEANTYANVYNNDINANYPVPSNNPATLTAEILFRDNYYATKPNWSDPNGCYPDWCDDTEILTLSGANGMRVNNYRPSVGDPIGWIRSGGSWHSLGNLV